jgi:hypothetical protein
MPPLFALGWIDATMLGWLAVAAAPILIHLWNRRRYRDTPWAAMIFLAAAVRRRHRRILLEQWLLLAVRTLLIVAVVAAVAQPYWEQSGSMPTAGGRTHRVLVFDASYSMDYRVAGKSRLEAAKEIAGRMTRAASRGDAFSVVTMGAKAVVGKDTEKRNTSPQQPPSSPSPSPSLLDANAAAQEIDRLAVQPIVADLPAAVAAVENLIERIGREEASRFQRQEVYFLTDLQRITWAMNRENLLQYTNRLAATSDIFVIDVGCPTAENLAVVDLQPSNPLVLAGRSVIFSVRLMAFGNRAYRHQAVELSIDGRRMAQKRVGVSPSGSASIEFSYRFDATGDHAVEVSAPGDALEIDNHRFLVVRVRRAMRALCIDGRPSGVAFHGAADYLAAALMPGKKSDDAALHAEIADENALVERNLDDYDCLFLCNVARFTAGEAGRLDAYLRAGGNVVFFLGDQVSAENYNRVLDSSPHPNPLPKGEGTGGILPAQLGAVIDRPPSLDPLGCRHPILRAFRGRGQSSLLTTVIYKYFRLSVPKESPAQVVLATADGDPLIVEQPVHRGRVVLIATSADTAWTAMPLWTSFVPLVQEIAAWCAACQTAQRNSSLAGNVDTAESDLARVGVEELRRSVWPGIPFALDTSWRNYESSASISTGRGRRMHVDLLYAALGLLLFETFWMYIKARRWHSGQ